MPTLRTQHCCPQAFPRWAAAGALLALALEIPVACAEPPAAPGALEAAPPVLQLPADYDHELLAVDPALGFQAVLEAALAADPRRVELDARGAEADALRDRGGQWLAATPALYFSYLSDRPLDDLDQREYEGGIELPFWRPGERDAARALATTARTEHDAVRAAFRFDVARQLRAILWEVESAAAAITAAEGARRIAAELYAAVERRHARGDLPLADVLLARAALLEQEQRLIESRARLVDAEHRYEIMTGLTSRPAELREALSPRTGYDPSHPVLALANAEVERARRRTELIDRETRGTPTLAIGPRRQRDPLTTFYNDSVAVGLRVPVGGKSYGATQVAAGARAAAEAEAARRALLRRLELDLHEAVHTLRVLDEATPLAQTRRDLADRQWQMAQNAFAQGEIELRELLRLQAAALEAAHETAELAIDRARAIGAYNAAVGEMP